MRFAFLIMGKFDSREDQAVIHNGTARIIGVSDLEDAARTAKRLEEEGIDWHRALRCVPGRGRPGSDRSHREPDPGGICDPPSRAG